jgi:DNA-directed RNA polymerase specialized sigma24 family protein
MNASIMGARSVSNVTQILSQIESGDPKAAEQRLPLVYDELRKLAAAKLAGEKPGQTLQATALAHEAFAAAAESMRRILVERARLKRSLKRGGHHKRVDLDAVEPIVLPIAGDDILGLEEVLQKLEQADGRKAELVKLRFFAGLTVAQAAQALGISATTANYFQNPLGSEPLDFA